MAVVASTESSVRPAVQPRAIVFAGLVALAVAMGIGRFAFTPLLPMMLHRTIGAKHVIDDEIGLKLTELVFSVADGRVAQ